MPRLPIDPEKKSLRPGERVLGLDLCNIDKLLTPEQRKQLDDDLASIARARRTAAAKAHTIYLA